MINNFKISAEGVELLQTLEGCELTAYRDGGGVLTIGYGHTGDDVYINQIISADRALMLLINDLCKFQKCITTNVKCKLNQQMFDALVIFCFNVGCFHFIGSTMLKLLNKNDYIGAKAQFALWNKDNGKVVKGLTARRSKEAALFNAGIKTMKG